MIRASLARGWTMIRDGMGLFTIHPRSCHCSHAPIFPCISLYKIAHALCLPLSFPVHPPVPAKSLLTPTIHHLFLPQSLQQRLLACCPVLHPLNVTLCISFHLYCTQRPSSVCLECPLHRLPRIQCIACVLYCELKLGWRTLQYSKTKVYMESDLGLGAAWVSSTQIHGTQIHGTQIQGQGLRCRVKGAGRRA